MKGPAVGAAGAADVREAHPGALELLDLVRGVMGRDCRRRVLDHCIRCRSCATIARVLVQVRQASGLGVDPSLERMGAPGPIH